MVQSVTPEDDCKILEKEIKAKRFAYKKDNVRNNPWGKSNVENEKNATNLTQSFNSSFEYPKPSQFKGKSLKHYTDISRSLDKCDDICSKPNQKGSRLLEKAWSIKNVPFASSQTNMSPTSLTMNPSFYSRYKVLHTNTRGSPLVNSRDNDVSSHAFHNPFQQRSSWNMKQSHFSYSKINSEKNVAAADGYDECEYAMPLANVVKSNHYGLNEGARPTSARTKKASKLHDAYLKSRGLGKYAAPSQMSTQQDEVRLKSILKDE